MWQFRNTSECARNISFVVDEDSNSGVKVALEQYVVILIIVAFGLFATGLAKVFSLLREKVFKDENNLDTAFDAGGKVSVGLTAATIVSQWTWAATLLQSSAVASKYGVSGSIWYATGAGIQLFLFAILSVQLKIRAPGAKTFLQVLQARFGRRTHAVYCGFALTTNIIVTAMLMLGGIAVLTHIVKNLSVELATMLLTAVIASYTCVGGLGATFYVSYFNTVIMLIGICIFTVYTYNVGEQHAALGSPLKVYDLIKCSVVPIEGNMDDSYLTFVSFPGFIFGIINIVGNMGTVFVDQSYWQSSVAAKPKDGVWGFLVGGFVWFAVPFAFSTTMGLAYISLSAQHGKPLLTQAEVDTGLVAPIVAEKLMGSSGEFLLVVILIMAITSTGSAEVIAVTSIIVYDIYGILLRPYRKTLDTNSCILCGKQRGRKANPRDKCVCKSKTYCEPCKADDQSRAACSRVTKPGYQCVTHGNYRAYTDYLYRLKNWGILVTSLAIIPLTLILNAIGISLGWVYSCMGILIGPAVMPISLAMFWDRLNAKGMLSGAIGGMFMGIFCWLIHASTLPGGLTDFLKNTGDQYSMLVGNLVSILSGGLLTVVVSLITNRNLDTKLSSEIWENTRDIDNPLSPWTELYSREFNLSGETCLDNRPPIEEISRIFRVPKLFACIGASVAVFVLIILWPASMMSVGVMDVSQFYQWIYVSESWMFVAAVLIIVLPVVTEAINLRTALNENKRIDVIT